MKQGPRRKTPIDFKKFEIFNFSPHLFDPTLYLVGCGISAISLLTGVNPYTVRRAYLKKKIPHSHPNHCAEQFVVEFLSKYFIVQELLVSDVTDHDPDQALSRVNENHLILNLQRWSRVESSYSVTWRKTCYHNFDNYPLDPFEFLNRPSESTYLLKKIK